MSRRRLFLFAHGLTAAAHSVVGFALAGPLGPAAGVTLAVVVWLFVAWRLHGIGRDHPRPRWIVALVDEPVFWHWGAAVIGTSLLPIGFVVLGIAAGAQAVTARFSTVALAAYGAGLVVSGWGMWVRRRRVAINEVEVVLPGLSPELDGYRVVQLSDLHVGSFATRDAAIGWALRANELRADLAVVTGDLVSSGTGFCGDAADAIASLRAEDGVFVSMGNHDQWDPDRFVAEIERRGPVVLRNQHRVIANGRGGFVLAGIDDRYTGRADLDATLSGRPAALPTVLLSHYPSYFEAAADRGVGLVLSGHTHGGQIGVPFLARRFNVATLTGQRGAGLYRRGRSSLYVNAGLGTTGPPIRLGVPPEIAVIVLRAGRRRGAGGAPTPARRLRSKAPRPGPAMPPP